jgi:GNAT superfamily N-acetyltransferase
MCAVEVRPLDPFDDEAMRAWYDVYRAALTHEREFHSAYAFEEVRATFRSDSGATVRHPLAALLDGRVVGVGGSDLPLLENRSTALVAVCVHPSYRRRGVGTALLTRAEEIARQAGRAQLLAEVAWPYDAGPAGRGAANVEFAHVHGFRLGLGNVQRVLDLPVPTERLDALTAQAAAKHEGYTFRQVTGPAPDDLALPLGELRAAVETEAPTGDIERERGTVDLAAIREDEAELAAMGRSRYATVAVAPDGSVAGYTDYVVPEHDRPWVYQWGTLVWKEHRGHALGLALKARNTAWVQQEHPDRTGVRTWNAEVNEPMIAVNEAMGFRPVERMGEFTKRLA